MNIAQALKEKNKTASYIQKLLKRAAEHNVAEKDQPKDYSSKELMKQAQEAIFKLIELKVKIHKATAPVREKIFRLSELKGMIKHVEYFPTNGGVIRNRTTGLVIGENVAEISTKEHETFLETTQKDIDQLQEELDAFNHTTSI